MLKEEITQSEEETKTPDIAEPVVEAEAPAEEPKEEVTIKDVVGEQPETPKHNSKPESVPIDVFIDMKKELKEEIRSLKKDFDSKGSVTSDLNMRDLASKHDVSEDLVADLANAIESKTVGAFEERFKSIEAKDKQKDVKAALDKHFAEAIEEMPEYKDIVAPDVIKSLALKAENQDKTFSQLIEETYSRAITGKRTVESTTPRGGQDPQTVDIKKAQTDPAYFKEVMADPDLKAQYNDGIENRINF